MRGPQIQSVMQARGAFVEALLVSLWGRSLVVLTGSVAALPSGAATSRRVGYLRLEAFSSTAAWTRALNASSSISSPSRKSIARLVLPSRLELKRPEGSSREAPLANVVLTTCL